MMRSNSGELEVETEFGDCLTVHYNCWEGECSHPLPLTVLFHGAGQTAETFTTLATLISSSTDVVAFDCRGHGLTKVTGGDGTDLSAERLTADGVAVIKKVLTDLKPSSGQVFIGGHSMGGAIACRVAVAISKFRSVVGCALFDVCGETALHSLSASEKFINKFPVSFSSVDAAVKWAAKNVVKTEAAAQISIPSQLRYDEQECNWKWRVDLKGTKAYWRDWFIGMDEVFLNELVCPRLVIVSHIDSIGKDYHIANMKGKLQVEVLEKTGHLIHEDQAESVCRVLMRFFSRLSLLNKLQKASDSAHAPA